MAENSSSLNGDVIQKIIELGKARAETFNKLIEKYSNVQENDVSFKFSDIIADNKYNYNVVTENEKDEEIAKAIEDDHNSNIYALIIKREKAKILKDEEGYSVANYKVKKELKRLLKHLSREDVVRYSLLCFEPREDFEDMVLYCVGDSFKKALFKQMLAAPDSDKFKKYNSMLKQQWKRLLEVMADHEITVYAVQVIRSVLNSSENE